MLAVGLQHVYCVIARAKSMRLVENCTTFPESTEPDPVKEVRASLAVVAQNHEAGRCGFCFGAHRGQALLRAPSDAANDPLHPAPEATMIERLEISPQIPINCYDKLSLLICHLQPRRDLLADIRKDIQLHRDCPLLDGIEPIRRGFCDRSHVVRDGLGDALVVLLLDSIHLCAPACREIGRST